MFKWCTYFTCVHFFVLQTPSDRLPLTGQSDWSSFLLSSLSAHSSCPKLMRTAGSINIQYILTEKTSWQRGSEIICKVQFAANIEQRYFCRRKIDVFVHICVYAENKSCILQLSYLYGIGAYLGFHSEVQQFLIKADDAMSFIWITSTSVLVSFLWHCIFVGN